MTSTQANSISIREYLWEMNIRQSKDKSYYGMYYSPFRSETEASFKVDFRKNLWYDFGEGKGGTMVDLVMKLNRCNFHEAMKILEGKKMPFFILPPIPTEKASKTILLDVLPLGNTALISYLSRRGINADAAQNQCVEVYYSIGNQEYFAIGFKNDAGGYELRNRYFKGSVSPKDITTFSLPTDDCMIFEGFMDYLSYLTIHQLLKPQTDTVVLNSTAHLNRAMTFLKNHILVHAHLDNDDAGKKAFTEISRVHSNVVDFSPNYKPYKDFNKYLIQTIKNQKHE